MSLGDLFFSEGRWRRGGSGGERRWEEETGSRGGRENYSQDIIWEKNKNKNIIFFIGLLFSNWVAPLFRYSVWESLTARIVFVSALSWSYLSEHKNILIKANSSFFIFCFIFFYFFDSMSLYSQGWLWTHCGYQADLELVIVFPQFSECWKYRCAHHASLFFSKLTDCAFGVIFKKQLPLKDLLLFKSFIYNFSSYTWACCLFWVHFCVWPEVQEYYNILHVILWMLIATAFKCHGPWTWSWLMILLYSCVLGVTGTILGNVCRRWWGSFISCPVCVSCHPSCLTVYSLLALVLTLAYGAVFYHQLWCCEL